MGSISAQLSLDRVINAHGDELIEEIRDGLPEEVLNLHPTITLENNTHDIQVFLSFHRDTLQLQSLHIDALAEKYPDCDVGY